MHRHGCTYLDLGLLFGVSHSTSEYVFKYVRFQFIATFKSLFRPQTPQEEARSKRILYDVHILIIVFTLYL